MDNYQYCVDLVARTLPGPGLIVLDYGCGPGHIVKGLRARDIEAFGCDIFYAGGDYSAQVPDAMLGSVILPMTDGRIPFPDQTFDLIVNNQVMEHVEHLDSVLAELDRVLKPGGVVVSLFPDAGVWREGHCGIAFLHWFPKRSGARIYYAALLRALGLGYFHDARSPRQWAADACDWLDQWTYYRPGREIRAAYGRHFIDIRHLEEDWLDARLGSRVRFWPAWVKRLFVRKLSGLVFLAGKPTSGSKS